MHYFNEWLIDYFFLSIHAHHDGEEEIFGPHYKNLGAPLDFGGTYTHEMLLNEMSKIENLSRALTKKVDSYEETKDVNIKKNLEAEITDDLAIFTEKFKTFAEEMKIHLKEEEINIPPIVKRIGRKEAEATLQKLIKKDLAAKGKEYTAFKLFAGAILDSMGGNKYPSLSTGLKLDPWCTEVERDNFVKSIPFIPRVFVFPGFLKEYATIWKPKIDCIPGTEDVIKNNRIKNGCSCNIS